MIKNIVIDAKNQIFYETTIDKFTDYYHHLDCDTFDIVRFEHGDCYVDDEGLYRNDTYGFIFNGKAIRGNGVIVGPVDDEGNSTDCKYSIEELKKIVQFFMG